MIELAANRAKAGQRHVSGNKLTILSITSYSFSQKPRSHPAPLSLPMRQTRYNWLQDFYGDEKMLGHFVGAVREPPDIRALLEAPLPHYNAVSGGCNQL
jgi:hypothetical protein